MRCFSRFRGLSSKIYFAFLVAAGVPVLVAGLVGIYSSLETLRKETLHHLEQEVRGRAAGMGHFFDQLASELLYLASSSLLYDLANSKIAADGTLPAGVRQRLERDYAAFARAYPYIYQVRFLDAKGREVIRVDRQDGRLLTVPERELQDKSDRYYVHDGLMHEAGQVYVSPLDLNVEHGQVEVPERPVIRFATPIVDKTGEKRGLLIVNLHAAYILGQIQEMAGGRGGVAYLFDRAGFYLSRTAGTPDPDSFSMQSVETLTPFLPRQLLTRVVGGKEGTEVLGDWIIAYAPIMQGQTLADRGDETLAWSIALAFPRNRLFEAVFNLYLLYGVLALSLLVVAGGGFLLSRHLLRPLTLLSVETEEIAKGNFSHRVEIRGDDEIADLGGRFNTMTSKLEQSYKALENRKGELEVEVQARTADLEHERSQLVTVIANTADGIVSVAADGQVVLANIAARRYLAGDGDLVGHFISEFWDGWDAYAAQESSTMIAESFDLQLHGRTLSLGIAPVLTGAAAVGFIVVVRDVTGERRLQDDRRELDRQMFQMEKMATLGEIAMGLAHEIGNPLAGIKAVAQLLQEDAATPAQREYLSRIEGEINRLSDFLRSFHGFAAPQETHPVPCRLEQVLEDVILWTRKEAKTRSVSIVYAPCGDHVPELWADPGQLKQLLLNLVINAIHAMPAGGSIRIGMCAGEEIGGGDGSEPRRMRFCVRDTGVGIAPEVLSRIFDPFFTTRADGSGIGLAVVKKIVMQHGAGIFVESTPGHGTCFELEWPIAPSSQRPPNATGVAIHCRRDSHG